MTTPLLIDVGGLSCGCTDTALETIYKAQRIQEDALWTLHHDPFVSDHIEAVTARGLGLLEAIQGAMALFLSGGGLEKADSMSRWSPEQLAAVRRQLEGKDRSSFDLSDWLLLVDWIVQRYLPRDTRLAEAEYLAVRSVFAGRIQAAVEGRRLSGQVKAALVAAAPAGTSQMEAFGRPSHLEAVVLKFAQARAAEWITDLGDRARHRIKSLIVAHEENVALGNADATVAKLQERLFDEFSILNRDWRRIAITETARNANEGFLAALKPGSRVKRVEAYATACGFCRSINGRIFTVVSPFKEGKDGTSEVWIGKTNVGRSAAPRRRVGDELVDRTEDELWWPAAGTQHPNCRGTWLRVGDTPPGMDPKFKEWMKRELANV